MKKNTEKIVKIGLLFIALFIINILVFKVVAMMGFDGQMTERRYVFPPLFATIVLLFLHKRQKQK